MHGMKLVIVSAAAIIASVGIFAAHHALAADAEPAAPGPAFMATAPAADVKVEDVEGGARLVFQARDAKDTELVRAFARQLAAHYQQGCPMMGAGPAGPRPTPGRVPGPGRAGGLACPRLLAPDPPASGR